MKLDIRGKHVEVDAALNDQVETRLRFALGRFAERIHDVVVRLTDVNGPRGGVDKRCQVTVTLKRSRRQVVVADLAPDIRVAVDRASDRLGRTVAREVERSHGFKDRTSASGI